MGHGGVVGTGLAIPTEFCWFWVCFTECFTRRLTIGRPTACPMVSRRAKRSPDSRGYCQGYGAGGRSGVCSVYTPAEPTIPLYRRYRHPSIATENIFFFHKISRYLTKFIFSTHNGFVPGPKWQGKSTFIVHVNQSSETTGPHVHLFPFLFT